jgi:hypothetical protein
VTNEDHVRINEMTEMFREAEKRRVTLEFTLSDLALIANSLRLVMQHPSLVGSAHALLRLAGLVAYITEPINATLPRLGEIARGGNMFPVHIEKWPSVEYTEQKPIGEN